MSSRLRTLKQDDGSLSLAFLSDEVYCPDETLEQWLLKNDTTKLFKVSYAEKYPVKRRMRLPGRPYSSKKYALRMENDRSIVVHRSWGEVKALREELLRGFPGAFIPPLPQTKVKNAMDNFFEFISCNPYLRNDVSMTIFTDPSIISFQKGLKKHKKITKGKEFQSIGRERWLQGLCTYHPYRTGEFKNNVSSFQNLRSEFSLALEFLLDLKKKVKSQMEIYESQALLSNDLFNSFRNLINLESNLNELKCCNTAELRVVSSKTANALHAQTHLLCKEYGAPMLKKRLIYKLDQEISILRSWKKHLKNIEEKAKELSELENRINSEERNKINKVLKQKFTRNELNLTILYQGLLGIELNMFRIRRVAVLKQLLQNLADFHILGAHRTYSNWNYNSCSTVVESLLDHFDLTESRVLKSKKLQAQVDRRLENLELVFLEVNDKVLKKTGAFKKTEFLKIKPGDKLIGQEIQNNGIPMFDAVSAGGEQGLIYADNVTVLSKLYPMEDKKSENTSNMEIISGSKKPIQQQKLLFQSPLEEPHTSDKSVTTEEDLPSNKLVHKEKIVLIEDELKNKESLLKEQNQNLGLEIAEAFAKKALNLVRPPFGSVCFQDEIALARANLQPVGKRMLPRKEDSKNLINELRKKIKERRSCIIEECSISGDTDVFVDPV